MESDEDSPTDVATLRARAVIVARSSSAPHLDTAAASSWIVLAGSILNTVFAGAFMLIIQREQLWLLWVLLVVPLLAPVAWRLWARLVRRRRGVAPAYRGRPRELTMFENRMVLWSIPFEVGVVVLAALTPAWVSLPITFVVSFALFAWLSRGYARVAQRARQQAR